jgi:hypothetical protein
MFEKTPENKENPSTIIIEIGPGNENYIQQYKKALSPNVVYKAINVNYNLLPNTKNENKKIIPLENESVNEIVLSNVLSDMANTNAIASHEEREFEQQILKSHKGVFRDNEDKWGYVQSEIAYYQKISTLTDAIRVLKHKGSLIIYENYRQFHPDAVRKVLAWLKNNPELEFTEDTEEEARIQVIFDEEFQRRVDKAKKMNPNVDVTSIYNPRMFNKVYKAIKK